MKQSLQLKLGQQLTMTPQLQQAIRLLQLSTLDLQQEIQQALDSNPLLELTEEGESHASEDEETLDFGATEVASSKNNSQESTKEDSQESAEWDPQEWDGA